MPGEQFRVQYPLLVVALDRAGGVPRQPGRTDERLAENFGAMGHLLVCVEGHGRHGGWIYDPATQVIACACGPLFQVCDPVTGAAA